MLTGQALIEQQDDGNQIAREKPRNGQRHDSIESRRTPDIDKRQQGIKQRTQRDRPQGQGGSLIDLRQKLGIRQTAVSGERPGLAGGGGEEADGGEDGHGDQDGGHGGGAGVGLGGVVEDLDEVVAGRGVEGGLQVADAEEEGDDGGEAEDAVDEDGEEHAARHDDGGVLDFFRHVGGAVVAFFLGKGGKVSWEFFVGRDRGREGPERGGFLPMKG